jgi:hypothetical protein
LAFVADDASCARRCGGDDRSTASRIATGKEPAMEDTVFHLDPAKVALVVVDMQNDFCHPRGVFADGTWSIAEFTAAIQPNARLIARARAADAAVIFTRIVSESG